MQFALNEDQIAVRDMARAFAAEKIAPHALEWDETKHFPVDVMREAASLGMGGIYIKDDVGGSAMTRFDAALNVPDRIAAAAYANGVVFRAFGDGVLGFAPALSFTAGEFDLLFERLEKTLDDVLAQADVRAALKGSNEYKRRAAA